MGKKAKGKAEKRKEYEAYITYSESSSGGDICSGQEEDSWPSHEDATIAFELLSLSADKGNHHWVHTFNSLLDPKEYVGFPVYLVIVRYFDGGTFGRTYGYWQIVDFYPHEEQAYKVADIIKDTKEIKHLPREEAKQAEKIQSDAIEEMKALTPLTYCTWNGYFSGLTSIEIHRLTMGEAPKVEQ